MGVDATGKGKLDVKGSDDAVKFEVGEEVGAASFDAQGQKTASMKDELSVSKGGVKRAEIKVADNDDVELDLKDVGGGDRAVVAAKGADLGATTCLSPVLLLCTPAVCAHLSLCFLQVRPTRRR